MSSYNATTIKAYLIKQYFYSDVTSGEFIHTEAIPDTIVGDTMSKQDVIKGIQLFLDWDESDEKFDVIKFGNRWYTTKHFTTYEDYFVFKGIHYPTKILNVTIDEHDDGWVHSYLVAPESLNDALQNSIDKDNDIDSEVYHYIEDQYWDLPKDILAKEYLDTPMTLIPDEDE